MKDFKKTRMLMIAGIIGCLLYRRICEKADIEFHGQHSLRYTFATRCIEAGVKPVVLKNWLGHTNIHITLDTYADVYGSLNSASLDTLEKYLEV